MYTPLIERSIDVENEAFGEKPLVARHLMQMERRTIHVYKRHMCLAHVLLLVGLLGSCGLVSFGAYRLYKEMQLEHNIQEQEKAEQRRLQPYLDELRHNRTIAVNELVQRLIHWPELDYKGRRMCYPGATCWDSGNPVGWRAVKEMRNDEPCLLPIQQSRSYSDCWYPICTTFVDHYCALPRVPPNIPLTTRYTQIVLYGLFIAVTGLSVCIHLTWYAFGNRETGCCCFLPFDNRCFKLEKGADYCLCCCRCHGCGCPCPVCPDEQDANDRRQLDLLSGLFGFTNDERHMSRTIKEMRQVSNDYIFYESLPDPLQHLVAEYIPPRP